MNELVLVKDPRHQVSVVTGYVDMQSIAFGAGRTPWPWMVRGMSCRTSMLDISGHPTLVNTDIRLLVQGSIACDQAAQLLREGDLVTVRGSLVELGIPTGGKFSGLGLLVGAIYPVMTRV